MKKRLIVMGAVLTMLASWPALSPAQEVMRIEINGDGNVVATEPGIFRDKEIPVLTGEARERALAKLKGRQPEGKLYVVKGNPHECWYWVYGGRLYVYCAPH